MTLTTFVIVSSIFVTAVLLDLHAQKGRIQKDFDYFESIGLGREDFANKERFATHSCQEILALTDDAIVQTRTPISVLVTKTIYSIGGSEYGCWSPADRKRQYERLRSIASERELAEFKGIVHLPTRIMYALIGMRSDLVSSNIVDGPVQACLADQSYFNAQHGEVRPITDEERKTCFEVGRG